MAETITCSICDSRNPPDAFVCSVCGSNLTRSTTRSASSYRTPALQSHQSKSGDGEGRGEKTLLQTLPMGIGFTLATLILFYGVGSLLPRAQALVFERGWIPFIVVGLFGWSMSILRYKYLWFNDQRKAFTLDLLPNRRINAADVGGISEAIRRECQTHDRTPQDYLLTRRIHRVLEGFRSQGSLESAGDVLRHGADADAATADSGYAILKVFLWAIPIFGFIGTVTGIGDAVQGFSSFIGGANDVSNLTDQLTPALAKVSSGLSVAFDTTLLALLLSVPTMVLTSHSQKKEDELLAEIETFCIEKLLIRLEEGAEAAPAPSEPQPLDLVQGLVDGAMRLMKESLTGFSEEVGRLVGGSLERFEQALQRVASGPFKDLGDKLNEVQAASDDLGRHVGEALNRTDEVAAALISREAELSGQIQEVKPLAHELSGTATTFNEVIGSLAMQRDAFESQGKEWLQAFEGTKQDLVGEIRESRATLKEVRKQLERPRPIRLKTIELIEDELSSEESIHVAPE